NQSYQQWTTQEQTHQHRCPKRRDTSATSFNARQKRRQRSTSDDEISLQQTGPSEPSSSTSSVPPGTPISSLDIKDDITNLYECIRKLSDTYTALVKDEVQAVTERVQSTEEVVSELKRGLTTLEENVHKLQSSNTNTNLRVDSLKDRGRRKNLKIKEVSEAVSLEELPHILRRLLAS
ncbi:Hypothetical predicted protein, partial [Pelobates cultripes]